MRFSNKIPELGDTRVVTRFLWFLETIRSLTHKETRWLETASWIETYDSFKSGDSWWPKDWLD